jgi:starch synthase (maltosyl-transferring)
VIVARVSPCIDGGRFAIKRCVGDVLRVEAQLACDGHDRVSGVALVRRPGDERWTERALEPRVNDRFVAEVVLDSVGTWELAVEGWVDAMGTWRHDLERRHAARDVSEVDLAIGAALVREAAERAEGGGARDDAAALRAEADRLVDVKVALEQRVKEALANAEGLRRALRHADRRHATRSAVQRVIVEPVHARFAAWYELFPRSTGRGKEHGTFRTAEAWLPYVASMGFDVLYLPPIHPIGRAHRKGPNNTLRAGEGDPGSPWAIGGPEGGHTAVHPALGTLEDFDRFVAKASEHGLKVALDIAFQASPDHPWVREHPSWFRRRPDGSIQYAENPPKKYQDVYPFDFECEDWPALWRALRDVFLFWIDHGVRIFRVDNPHTKPVRFWEWCLASVRAHHPDVTFLSEAFTRPTLKYGLGKIGFSQGYTYFTWRHTPHELREYLTELTRTEAAEYFRPSLWPNTPDILPEDLQHGGKPAFLARLVLAATLSSHYGIYGPAFELLERTARPGSGEYIDNEKYELKDWDLDAPHSIRSIVTAINGIRRAHPALWKNDSLVFHASDNDRILCYSKHDDEDLILVAINMNPHHRQSGFVQLDLRALGIAPEEGFQVHDLLGGGRYLWSGARNYLDLDPHAMPAQVFAVRRRLRTEQDFDYFL